MHCKLHHPVDARRVNRLCLPLLGETSVKLQCGEPHYFDDISAELGIRIGGGDTESAVMSHPLVDFRCIAFGFLDVITLLKSRPANEAVWRASA